MFAYYIITDDCNYRCDFCIRKNLEKNNLRFMDVEKFSHAIERIESSFGKTTVVITGGEPFMHPKWKDFLEIASNKCDSVIITSNGSFSKEIADFLMPFLKKNVYLQMSLDGTEQMHDSLRGKNAYSKVLYNLQYLESVCSHIVISTTVSQNNYKDIINLAQTLNNYSFKHWKVSPEQVLTPKDKGYIKPDNWNDFVDKLLPYCSYLVHIQKIFDFTIMDQFLKENYDLSRINCNCGIGRSKIYLSPNYDIIPCSCMPDRLGNLFELTSQELLLKLLPYSKIVHDSKSVCGSCKYLKICNGGCPGYSKKVFGVLNMGDIRCPKISSFYEKR